MGNKFIQGLPWWIFGCLFLILSFYLWHIGSDAFQPMNWLFDYLFITL